MTDPWYTIISKVISWVGIFLVRHCRCATESPRSLRRSHWDLRSLQLYVTMVNVVHQNLIFTWKVICLAVCIVNGYAAIAHFSDHPFFGLLYYVVFFESSVIYTVMYAKGFKVPYVIGEARNAFRLRALRLRNQAERNVLWRQVKSVPSAGIKVGEFHVLERTTTPVFLHYVLINIVNMLMANR